jgi:acyl-CoA synthetase (AMP-forming)/AMP-acid ligase II
LQADLISVLRTRSQRSATQLAYTFLVDGTDEGEQLTFGQLDERARSLGAVLASSARRGERALLLFQPGHEYLIAFLGCLYGGIVAVPAYPPEPARLARTLPRLIGIVRDARPQLVLTTSALMQFTGPLFEAAPELKAPRWIACDSVGTHEAANWIDPDVDATTLAFLQYTSGSTGDPRGVMVSHGNLSANARAMCAVFGQTADTIAACWLPAFHDMGLIDGLLQPLFIGYPTYSMSPMAFLQHPVRWLKAISKYRVTHTGAPNFAYDLCVRKISEAERAMLDLSCWQTAYNGAEPVRLSTLERFADTFSACGFRRASFFPCYGLAEATLYVSGGLLGEARGGMCAASDALERDRVVEVPSDLPAREVASCGTAADGTTIAIVDPVSGLRSGDLEVGEIYVRGPMVAQGYWGRPEDSAKTFQAFLGGEGPFLRTGDLGFLRDGSLYVTGRAKDLIIIHGRNQYPHDIETTIERVHRAIRPGCSAAFSIEVKGQERLVVALEIERRHLAVHLDELKRQLRRVVAETFDLQLHDIVPLEPGTVPKTSSGKIQRRASCAAYIAGKLERFDQPSAPSPLQASEG